MIAEDASVSIACVIVDDSALGEELELPHPEKSNAEQIIKDIRSRFIVLLLIFESCTGATQYLCRFSTTFPIILTGRSSISFLEKFIGA